MHPSDNHRANILKMASARALKDPAWFYNKVLRFPAKPWQLDATNAVLDVQRKAKGVPTLVNHEARPRISIRSCHGPGKTQFLAMLMHLWNFTTYGKIACTAPKEAQLLRRLIPRYRTAMRDADSIYREHINVLGKEIRVFGDPDWGAVMETASDPDNLAGYHDNPQLFLIDEASAKRLDSMFPVIEGALTTPGSVSVEIGNPTREEGEFFNHHNREKVKDLYFLMHIQQQDAPDLVSEAWLDAMRIKYGEDSPIYKIRALGEFASFDEYVLIPISLVEDAMDDIRAEDGSIPRLRVSIDVADGGADSTVVTVAKHYRSFVQILRQLEFNFAPAVSVIEAAVAGINLFEAFGGIKSSDDFVVDGNGVGAGTAGYLMKKGYTVINYKDGSTKGVNTEQYRNNHVQSSISLYNAFLNQEIAIAPDAIDDPEEFRAQMTCIKRKEGTASKVDDVQSKKEVKADGLPSPDRFDSIKMQFVDRVTDQMSASNQPFEALESVDHYEMAI